MGRPSWTKQTEQVRENTMSIHARVKLFLGFSIGFVPSVLGAGDSEPIRQAPRQLNASEHGVGRLVPDVEVTDVDGNNFKLSDFGERRALVVALTGTGCPLCQRFAPTLAKLEKTYRDKGIAFLLVNPNESESVKKVKAAIRTHDFESPYVRDNDEKLVQALDARTTTEVFVLDSARTLVYRGAVDDQYGFGYSLNAPRNTYLADALDAVLAGEQPEVEATWAPGCELWLGGKSGEPIAVTYHNRISRIIQRNCLECHREGGLAPFSLATYDDVEDYAGMIRVVVERGIMPPWFAAPHEQDEPSLWWANDRSLSEADKADLMTWLKSSQRIGDAADAPRPREFPDEWAIGKPDAVVQLPNPIGVKATGRMPYQHVRIETKFGEEKWVQAVELQPTDRAVVHHVLVFVQDGRGADEVDERGGFLAAYVPGNSSQVYPDGFAKKLPAGATLTFQLHYTPNGVATQDQTRLGIVFAKQPPQHVVRNEGIANLRLSIPPGASNHAEHAKLDVPTDIKLLAVMPHMHLRGKAFRFDLVSPNGNRHRLLDVPRYDFNWQLEYRLAEPLDVPRGSRIELTGWYDNSADNPANPDPTQTVRWGPQTEDEMMLGYVEYYVPSETVTSTAGTPKQHEDRTAVAGDFLAAAFKKADRNGDGKVTAEEFPKRKLFKRLDDNGDGLVTLDEARSVLRKRRGSGRQ
jgi:peroxiredoxin